MKKIRDFIRKKGGVKVFLISVALIVVALALILVGCIYAYWDGEWDKIPQMLTSDFAISVYVISGVVILLLFYVTIIANRDKEIK